MVSISEAKIGLNGLSQRYKKVGTINIDGFCTNFAIGLLWLVY
jgi:hypothetical protein